MFSALNFKITKIKAHLAGIILCSHNTIVNYDINKPNYIFGVEFGVQSSLLIIIK